MCLPAINLFSTSNIVFFQNHPESLLDSQYMFRLSIFHKKVIIKAINACMLILHK